MDRCIYCERECEELLAWWGVPELICETCALAWIQAESDDVPFDFGDDGE